MQAHFPQISASPIRWWQWGILALGFWTSVSGVFVLSQLPTSGGGWQLLSSSLARWWSWGLLTPVIAWLDRQLPFSARQLPYRIVCHLLIGPIFIIVYGYLSAFFAAAGHIGPWSAIVSFRVLLNTVHGLFWSMLVYGLIVGVYTAHAYQQRYVSEALKLQRLERSFSESRLNTMRMQLDPHFLFNALNTISAQVEHEPKLARTMIEHLGDLLRLSLAPQFRNEISLMAELAFLDHYLAIQKIRFGDKLNLMRRVPDDVMHAAVPSLFLQPLVENAIRHGLSPRASGGTISLVVERLEQHLHIEIVDDGVGLPLDWPERSQQGVGLSATRERIANYVDGSGRFRIYRRVGGGTAVDILFPFRLYQHANK